MEERWVRARCSLPDGMGSWVLAKGALDRLLLLWGPGMEGWGGRLGGQGSTWGEVLATEASWEDGSLSTPLAPKGAGESFSGKPCTERPL